MAESRDDGAWPNEQIQEILRQASAPNEQIQEILRQASAPNEQIQEILRQASAPNEQTQEILRRFRSERLVPESSFDEEVADPTDEDPQAEEELPAPLEQLKQILEEGKREYSTRNGILTFSIPAGRASREVSVDEEGATLLVADEDFLDWRSLTQYDGIWNAERSVIEVAVRSERHGPPPSHVMRRLLPDSGPAEDNGRLVISSSDSLVTLSIGRSNSSAAAILGPRRSNAMRGRTSMTIRLEGCSLGTTDDTEALIERVSDSFFFDLDVTRGLSLVLSRLESRSRPERWRERSNRDLRFPQSAYPHAPILLYRLGRDRSLPPVIRYWALYQVLEYFFPKYANQAAAARLGRHLRSPTFDPHSQEDITKAIALSGRSSQSGEREDLAEALAAITSADELRDVIKSLEIGDRLRKTDRALSSEMVDVGADDVVRQLARRIYDIRCKIVHSKSNSAHDEEGPGLIPGTADDDLLLPELPVLDYLAQQAIVASGDRLQFKSSTAT